MPSIIIIILTLKISAKANTAFYDLFQLDPLMFDSLVEKNQFPQDDLTSFVVKVLARDLHLKLLGGVVAYN